MIRSTESEAARVGEAPRVTRHGLWYNTLSTALKFAHIHSRKEIENYFLIPTALQRAIDRSIESKGPSIIQLVEIDVSKALMDITEPMQSDVQAQIVAKRGDYLRSGGRDSATITAETIKSFNARWQNLTTRLELVSGKETLAKLRTYLKDQVGVSLTDTVIIESMRRDEFPNDLVELLTKS